MEKEEARCLKPNQAGTMGTCTRMGGTGEERHKDEEGRLSNLDFHISKNVPLDSRI